MFVCIFRHGLSSTSKDYFHETLIQIMPHNLHLLHAFKDFMIHVTPLVQHNTGSRLNQDTFYAWFYRASHR